MSGAMILGRKAGQTSERDCGERQWSVRQVGRESMTYGWGRRSRLSRTGLGRRRGHTPTGGVEDEGLHLALITLRRQFLAVEFEVEGGDVTGTHDNLFLGVNSLRSRCGYGIAQDFAAVGLDRDPTVILNADTQGECGRSWRRGLDRHRCWDGRHRSAGCRGWRGLFGCGSVGSVALARVKSPTGETDGGNQQNNGEDFPRKAARGLFNFADAEVGRALFWRGFRFGVGRRNGGEVVGDDLVFVHADDAGVSANETFIKDAAGKLLEVIFLESLQHAGADLGGVGDFVERDTTLLALLPQFRAKGWHGISC